MWRLRELTAQGILPEVNLRFQKRGPAHLLTWTASWQSFIADATTKKEAERNCVKLIEEWVQTNQKNAGKVGTDADIAQEDEEFNQAYPQFIQNVAIDRVEASAKNHEEQEFILQESLPHEPEEIKQEIKEEIKEEIKQDNQEIIYPPQFTSQEFERARLRFLSLNCPLHPSILFRPSIPIKKLKYGMSLLLLDEDNNKFQTACIAISSNCAFVIFDESVLLSFIKQSNVIYTFESLESLQRHGVEDAKTKLVPSHRDLIAIPSLLSVNTPIELMHHYDNIAVLAIAMFTDGKQSLRESLRKPNIRGESS